MDQGLDSYLGILTQDARRIYYKYNMLNHQIKEAGIQVQAKKIHQLLENESAKTKLFAVIPKS